MTIAYIKSDLYRYCGNTKCSSFIKQFILSYAFRYQVYLRMSNAKGAVKYLGRLLHYASRFFSKRIQISYKTKIGYGLYIGHYGPVVVSPCATIGDNCNLSQFVTIGTNRGRGATIGDNVYIGPSVCIVESVNIGDNVTIGAGSVVTKDIPENATAAGNYAKVLNYNEPGRFVQNRWNRA